MNETTEDPRTGELRRAGAVLRRWLADERTDGPAAFAPNAIVRFGPELIESFETVPAAEASAELVEAARAILTSEGELDDDPRPPCIPDHSLRVWREGCAYDNDRDQQHAAARQPRPGDRYRQKERPARVVDVESVFTVREAVSVEFVDVDGALDVDEQPAGFTMSFPLGSFLEHFEPADAPTGSGVGTDAGTAG